MKKYAVYGVGNALVDTEFEVPDSFFTEHGIEKGCMTLVSREQQQHLTNILSREHEIKKRCGGGSACNTLFALTNFGGKAFYACKVADDEIGAFFLGELGDENIDTSVSKKEEGVSGQCIIMVSPDAERTMNTYLGVSETLSISELDFNIINNCEYVYIEGYLVTSPSAKSAIIKLKEFAKKNGVKVAFTFSDPAVVQHFREPVNEVLKEGIDLLFCNEQELKIWAGTENFEDACEAMKKIANQFVITRGPRGALLFDGENHINISANKAVAVDTNGAGDMFAGAFLYGITAGFSFDKSGELASSASAKVVTRFGSRLTPEQHKEIKSQVLGNS
ncbi:adenosine kinase [Gammaproteobacteria bacterium]|nr:adenosine kinase [Gammaproteobacteria bacterium]